MSTGGNKRRFRQETGWTFGTQVMYPKFGYQISELQLNGKLYGPGGKYTVMGGNYTVPDTVSYILADRTF